jgi:hypothetical protein
MTPDQRRTTPLVQLLATGWSHAHGGKPLNLVPCRWRMTRAPAGGWPPARPRGCATRGGVLAFLATMLWALVTGIWLAIQKPVQQARSAEPEASLMAA